MAFLRSGPESTVRNPVSGTAAGSVGTNFVRGEKWLEGKSWPPGLWQTTFLDKGLAKGKVWRQYLRKTSAYRWTYGHCNEVCRSLCPPSMSLRKYPLHRRYQENNGQYRCGTHSPHQSRMSRRPSGLARALHSPYLEQLQQEPYR